ncbi:MAG: alpha-2-macroglobulin family protein, partial [Muribaculaceae bacterium]
DFAALYALLEAKAYAAYRDCTNVRRAQKHETLPDDITEWSFADFSDKISQLVAIALSDKTALKNTPTSRFRKVLNYTEEYLKFYPTLLDFCYLSGGQLLESIALPLTQADIDQWLSFHDNEIAPTIYIKNLYFNNFNYVSSDKGYDKATLMLYRQYAQFEESGLLLRDVVPNQSENYQIFCDYLERFPNSVFAPDIKNIVSDLERKDVSCLYAQTTNSKSKIKVDISYANVNYCTLYIYRHSDDSRKATKEPVKNITLHFDGKIPFKGDTTIYIDPLPYGIYSIAPSFKYNNSKGAYKNSTSDVFYVSDIEHLVVSNIYENNKVDVYAVNAYSGKPIEGVELYYKEQLKGTSDASGKIEITNNKTREYGTNYLLKKGSDIYGPRFSDIYFYNYDKLKEKVNIFTDLAIYRPGETIHYAVVASSITPDSSHHLAGKVLTVKFHDPNGKEVAKSDSLITDADGRIYGSFVVPTDRMNGSFCISVLNANRILENRIVEVSEYKAPTFEIVLEDAQLSYNKGEDVKISGKIVTFAGMPVANSSIISYLTRALWYQRAVRSNGEPPLHQDTITTDANGCFAVTLPAKLFDESDKKHITFYSYNLSLACTSKTGETQEASHRFYIGKHRRILLGDATFVNDAPIKLNVSIESSDPADKDFNCHYTLTEATDTTKVVAQGSFSSADTRVDLTKVRSGRYTLTVSDASGLAEDAKCAIVLYRESDKLIPVEAALWMPECGRNVNDKNRAVITLGTSLDEAYVYYNITAGSTVLSEGWKQLKKGLHHIEFDMPKTENTEVFFQFHTLSDSKWTTHKFSLISPLHARTMKLEAVSFRDKIASGSHEKWTFRLTDNLGKPLAGYALLALTDKAINSIMPNSFSFNKFRYFNMSALTVNKNYKYQSYSSFYWRAKQLNGYNIPEFDFNLYGKRLFLSRPVMSLLVAMDDAVDNRNVVRERKAKSYDTGSTASAFGVKAEACEEECLEIGAVDYNTVTTTLGEAFEKVVLHESEIKTAIWLPNITTEPDGSFTVEFDAPNINTTWLLQSIAYNANMLTSQFSRDVVSDKPIMVKANMPRFVRSGDSVTLAADLANKTDEPVQYSAVIELFDPRTLEIKASKEFTDSIAPMSNTALTIDYAVPADIEFLGFRIKAFTGTAGDGEQVMVPVLSDVSPVTESTPFFIDAKRTDFTAQLPQLGTDARITLEYCDNPLWYCATALPTIFNKDARTSTSLAHSLYALAVAEGIAKRTPQLTEAIAYWKAQPKEQSALTSMLEKNADLKIGTLLASPWINEAERQTLRMNSLDRLFDTETNASSQNEILTRLTELQMSDGGFAWIKYNDCHSSLYCTGSVLELIGEIQQLGFLKGNKQVDAMVAKAIKYYDREYLKIFNEIKLGKNTSLAAYGNYVYVRQLHKQHAVPEPNLRYCKRIVDDIAKHWGDASTITKAYYAIILNREGRKSVARSITESIRQFSITTPARGMYWDTPDMTSHFGNSQVSATSTVLLALNEVDHRTDEIDQIRKWILLNKQTNDWGDSSLASQAVYSILSTGSEWLTMGGTPAIIVGGKPVELTNVDRYLGYARKEIPVTDASNAKVEISRTNGTSPAWGAIYCQYAAPITQIREQKVDELSISKQILVYDAEGKLTKATDLKLGDKVRIELTIKCGKNMEYVTLNDQRGACFEPVDKISTYDYQHGCCMYREIKDFATNIFIPYLSKGTHVVNYDCYVTNSGSFGIGIATIQCQYAPQFVAHSAGNSVIVK